MDLSKLYTEEFLPVEILQRTFECIKSSLYSSQTSSWFSLSSLVSHENVKFHPVINRRESH